MKEVGQFLIALVVVPFFFVTIFFVTEAFGAGGGHAGAHHEPSIADLGWYYINFVFYLAVLLWLVREPIRKSWAARRHRIETAVREAGVSFQEAEEAFRVVENKLAGIEEEIRALREEILADGEREADLIRREAHDRSARMVTTAKGAAEAEQRQAEKELRNEVVETVIENTRQRLIEEVDTSTDREMRKAAIANMGSLFH